MKSNYGHGRTNQEAQTLLQAHKADRQARRERGRKASRPPGVYEQGASGDQVGSDHALEEAFAGSIIPDNPLPDDSRQYSPEDVNAFRDAVTELSGASVDPL